jgi:hypothetical protein
MTKLAISLLSKGVPFRVFRAGAAGRVQKKNFSANCMERGSVWMFVMRPNWQPS